MSVSFVFQGTYGTFYTVVLEGYKEPIYPFSFNSKNNQIINNGIYSNVSFVHRYNDYTEYLLEFEGLTQNDMDEILQLYYGIEFSGTVKLPIGTTIFPCVALTDSLNYTETFVSQDYKEYKMKFSFRTVEELSGEQNPGELTGIGGDGIYGTGWRD